ncbi:hypothetical protein ACFWBF_04005 [Streptomyces sp. NPDC060028]|uniref:hypothetical protein n=1 Tax=Streptomyces sp. NPDC060028 TaxID=3347041 RepID=UPI0036B8C203
MSAERAQGRGWVRIPASRGEQPAGPAAAGTATAGPPPYEPYEQYQPYEPYQPYQPYEEPAYTPHAPYPPYASSSYGDQTMIYMSLVKRWREAGRTLPGHPDEEWERLISQPYWPGR